jgi:type IX secretion system PorP/SprF family membrane protein
MFTNLANNPAFAGSNDGICVTGLIRQQSIGFKDYKGKNLSPLTYYISVDSPLRFLHGGVGASVMSDQIAQFNHTEVRVDYAYRTELGNGDFSAGAQLDLINSKVKIDDFDAVDQGDAAILGTQGKDDMVLDMGIGFLYKVPEKYYIALSGTDLLQSKESKIYYRLKRTFFLTGGYNWTFPNSPLFELQPSALIKTDFATFQVDITALLMYNKKFYGGLAYRYQESISALVGFNIKSFRIGIAYDASMIGALKKNSGGLEVMASYLFKISTEKFRKSYKNTRFL